MRILDKKLLRGIARSKGQALAATMVILCGAASYICMASAHRDLKDTRDAYYKTCRFADFTIHLERAPMTAMTRLYDIPGVREVRGRIVEDAKIFVKGTDESKIGRIVSMPDLRRPVINDISIESGNYFLEGTRNEVIVNDPFVKANGLKVGDTIEALIDEKKHKLRIVGTALSPEYVYMIRNPQEIIPDPKKFGILWVPQSFAEMAFDMNGACNNIVGLVDAQIDSDEERGPLDAILDSAEKTLKPYGVFASIKRGDQISHRFLSDEITGLEVGAKIVPTIFMGVAAFILMVLLNRMVRHERTQIGLLKAYGYSNFSISFHYLKYALIMAALACVGGFAFGQWMANGLLGIYVDFYKFPLLKSSIHFDVVLKSAIIATLSAVAGATSAASRASAIRPAESMRPPTPRSAHRTLLERIPALWRSTSFVWKMVLRNVARYRLRASFSVLGVMISSGLLLIGFFGSDSVDYMLDFQFSNSRLEDIKLMLTTERGKDAIHEIQRLEHVRHAEASLVYPFEITSQWHKKRSVVTGVVPGSRLSRLFDEEGRTVNVEGMGLIVSDKLAEMLAVEPGSRVILKPLQGRVTKEVEVTVRKVVRQYLGSGAYMDHRLLSRILDEPFVMNAALLVIEPGTEKLVESELKDVPGIAEVDLKEEALNALRSTLAESMNISNAFLCFFSGVIAFAVIYNTTIVSLMERRRELASLRVMGFTKAEVGRIMYYENFLLSFFGILLGMPFGVALCKVLVNAYDTELYRLPFHIEGSTFATSILLTIGFVTLANLSVAHRVAKLDLIEVLKLRE